MELPRIGTRTGDDGLDLPRPLRSGLAVGGVGVLPLLLGLTAVIRPLSGLVFAGIFVAAGALQTSLAYSELVGIRRRADLELRLETRPYLQSSLARWLAALERPVTPQAVLQVEELLTSPASPLYARERARELGASLLACIDAVNGVRDEPLVQTAATNGSRIAKQLGRR